MITRTLRTRIAHDGSIDLHIPSSLPPGDAEVVVVVQPAATGVPAFPQPPYPSDHGVWRGKLPDADIDADLREMHRLWEAGMELPT